MVGVVGVVEVVLVVVVILLLLVRIIVVVTLLVVVVAVLLQLVGPAASVLVSGIMLNNSQFEFVTASHKQRCLVASAVGITWSS